MKDRHCAVALDIEGLVQGVGFRPFAARLAARLALAGRIANVAGIVRLELEGERSRIETFLRALFEELPPPARIDSLAREDIRPRGLGGFEILPGASGEGGGAGIVPDLAICEACRHDLFDAQNRRYRYPFVTCTGCGPRWSILFNRPWARANTTMRGFALCATCRAEYADPADRRYHAETIACPACGPQLALLDPSGRSLAPGEEALLRAQQLIDRGGVLALKGLGGYQLLVDATSPTAVERLRRRKHRPARPFALVAADRAEIARIAEIDEVERQLLASPEAPIVLLRRRADAPVAEAVAPGLPWLGVMRATTPLHLLLLEGLGRPLVATSGNRSGEPMAIDEKEALARLGDLADAFLCHDRPIARPVDDSVVRVIAGAEVVLRRARGYVPAPLALPRPLPPAVAVGGHLRAAVAAADGGRAVLGGHVGDLDHPAARALHRRQFTELPQLTGIRPRAVACDTHPGYASCEVAAESGLPRLEVAHHFAHLLSCIAENRHEGPVLAIAFDGTGDGGDGTIWGGEFLAFDGLDDGRWRRVAHLRSFRLPGGEAAVREPRRAAVGLLYELCGFAMPEDAAPLRSFGPQEQAILRQMLARGVNSPRTTSAGRLFDAVAALLDLVQVSSYEAEAALRLEALAQTVEPVPAPAFAPRSEGDGLVLDWGPFMRWLLDSRPRPAAASFHAALAQAVVATVRTLGARTVALTGGCFQNRILSERIMAGLEAGGVRVLRHRRVPPGDGGLALGQLLAMSWWEEKQHVPRGSRPDRADRG